MKRFTLTVAALLAILIFGCGQKTLIGVWKADEASTNNKPDVSVPPLMYDFRENGTVMVFGETTFPVRDYYTYEGSQLNFERKPDVNYIVTFSGSKLILSYKNGDELKKIVFVRGASADVEAYQETAEESTLPSDTVTK